MGSAVLIVEDDDVLRWLMAEVVTHLGHTVTQCANADEAFAHLSQAASLELVITDVRMPGKMDGVDLAKAVWSTRPELPVIIVSAHWVVEPGFLPDNARFIAKPCTVDALSEAIEDLI